MSRSSWNRALVALLAVVLGWLPGATMIQAATETWSGGGATWNSAGSWTGPDLPPVAGDSLVFDGTLNLAANNNYPGNPPTTPPTLFGGITFAPTAGAFTLSGNAVLLNGNINQNSANNEVISLPLFFDNSTVSINKPGAGTLSLGQLTFGATPASTNVSTLNVNDNVSAISLTVQTNATANNAINIASGKTLSVSGAFSMGTAPGANGTSATVNTSANLVVSGTGTLNMTSTTNTSFNIGVGAGSNTPTGQPLATMDLTGLSNFVFSTGTGSFGVGNLVTRSSSMLRLANTSNSITAANLVVGDSNQSGGNNGGAGSTLFLGAGSNVLNVNTINVGFTKSTGSIQFQSGSGSVTIGGEAGGAATTNIVVGRGSSATDTGTTRTFLLAGHTANIQAGTVQIGVLAGATGGTTTGQMTFDTGTFNVSSLQLAVSSSGSAPNGANGIFIMGGAAPNTTATGVLNVSTQFFLANRTNASGGNATGTFTLNGGTVNTSVDITDPSTQGGRNTTLNLAGGTLNMNGHAIGSAASPITNVNFPAAGQTSTIQTLGGAGVNGAGLTMNTAGTLVLAGSNTFIGGTNVNSGNLAVNGTNIGNITIGGGTLLGTGTVSGAVTLNSGNLSSGAAAGSTSGTLTLSNGLTTNGGNLLFDVGSASSNMVAVTGGAASFSNTGVSFLLGGAPTSGSQFTLLTAPSAITGLTLNPVTIGRTTLTPSVTGSNLIVMVSGNAGNLIWIGDGSANNWDVQVPSVSTGTPNWNNLNGSNPDVYFDGDAVTFNDTSANKTVNLNTTVSPSSVTFNTASAYTLTGSGAIAGSTNVSISGGGSVALSTVNSYTGTTTVSGAGTTLIVNNLANGGTDSNIGSASSNVILDGGALRWTGGAAQATNRGITITQNGGTLDFSPTAGVALTLNGVFTMSGSGSRTLTLTGNDPTQTTQTIGTAIGNPATGATSVVMNGNGSIQLNVASTYSGGTMINSGRLRTGNGGAFGSGAVTVASGAQAYLNAAGTYVNNFNLAGIGLTEGNPTFNAGAMRLATNSVIVSGTVTLNGDTRISARGATAAGATISGQITGNHALELGTAGTAGILTLANTSNNWTGGTNISLGTVRPGASSNSTAGVIPHGAGFGDLTITGITNDAANSGVSTLDLNGQSLIVNGLNSAGDLSEVTITNNSATATGTLTVGDGNANGSYAGPIVDGSKPVAFSKIGSGTQTLSGVTSYSGATAVTGGTLAIVTGGQNNIPNTPTITVGANGMLDVSGASIGFQLANNQVLTNNGHVVGTVNMGGGQTITGTGVFGDVVMTNGTLTPGTPTAVGTMASIADLSVAGGVYNIKVSGATADRILSVPGTASFGSNNNLVIQQLVAPTASSYTVLTASTLTGLSAGDLTTIGRSVYSIDAPKLSQNTLQIDVSGGPAHLFWTGSDTNTDPTAWDNFQSNANWITTESSVVDKTHFYDLDFVTFDVDHNTGGQFNININSTVSPSSVSFVQGAANTYILNGGPIGGAGSLVLNSSDGTGVLQINNSNNYTGGTSIQSGTLHLGNSGALGNGAVAFIGGVVDNVSGGDMILNNNVPIFLAGALHYVGTSNGLNLGTGPVTLNAATTVTVDSNTLTIGGAIADGLGNSLSKQGAGTLVLSGASSFSGGITVNNGSVRFGAVTSAGTGAITVNPTGTAVLAAGQANAITLAGGTLGGAFTGTPAQTGDVTAAANTSSILYTQDPANLTAAIDAVEMNFTGNWHGSGNVTVLTGNDTNPDSGDGFRLRGTGVADFSGVLTIGNNVKGELQSAVAGPAVYSPAGTAKIVITAGDASRDGSQTAVTGTGGYSELNLRDNSTGNNTFGNNVEVAGTGLAVVNPLGSAPVNATVTMGNLKIGDGQELGVYLATSTTVFSHTLAFPTVTLNGGNATFSPKPNGFGSSSVAGANLSLGNISELVPGSSITMAGLNTLFLTGNSTYTGGTTVNSGSVVVSNGHALGTGPLTINAGTVTANPGLTAAIHQSNLTIASGALLQMNDNDIIVDYTAGNGAVLAGAIRADLLAGYNGGAWNGTTGIASATAAADSTHLTALGYADAGDVGLTIDDGVSVPSNAVVVRYTYYGDASLDGKVDLGNDFNLFLIGYLGQGSGWELGDFNYDGVVDNADFGMFIDGYKLQNGSLGALDSAISASPLLTTAQKASLLAVVPEPASMGLLSMTACAFAMKRRRK